MEQCAGKLEVKNVDKMAASTTSEREGGRESEREESERERNKNHLFANSSLSLSLFFVFFLVSG